MPRQLTTSRASRNRRLIAMSIWLGLVMTALVLWNSRTQHAKIFNPSEPIAFLLAAFTTFVSLFAWMLFNPARGVSAETTTLMLAGAATLFPPCIIAFCTMPPGSPLSGWLTAGLFVLLVIAVMSPVPDEFFGIPRDRQSYFQQISMVGLGNQSVLDLHPDWLQTTDLTTIVPESDRPSLAPSSWRDQEQLLPRTERRRKTEPDSTSNRPPADSAPLEKRRGIFRRLRDRASSRRDDRSKPDGGSADEQSAVHEKTPNRTKRPIEQPHDPFTAESLPPAEPRGAPLADSITNGTPPEDSVRVAEAPRDSAFERVTDELGGEMVEGTVTVRFDRGQKRANVHVPFSPPLSGTPDVECDTVDDESIRLKVAERRSWGLRIEGRRTDTDAPQEADISFSAVYVPSR